MTLSLSWAHAINEVLNIDNSRFIAAIDHVLHENLDRHGMTSAQALAYQGDLIGLKMGVQAGYAGEDGLKVIGVN